MVTPYLGLSILAVPASAWVAGLACRARSRRRALIRHAVPARARVIALEDEPGRDGDSPVRYIPRVRYRDAEGRSHVMSLGPVSDPRRYAVGTVHTIYHQRDRPENAAERLGTADADLACALALGLLLLAGLCVADALRRQHAAPPDARPVVAAGGR